MTQGGAWTGFDPVMLVVVAGLVVLSAVLFAALLFSRKRHATDAREVVRAMEELRAGELPDTGVRDPGSPLALVFDAVQRLGQDLGTRVRGLEEADAKTRRLMEVLDDVALVTTDLDGDVRSMSGGASALFGWTEPEILGQRAEMLFDEAEFKEFLPKLARRELRERGIQARVRLRRRDGRIFPADVYVRQLAARNQAPTGFVLRVRDAGERVELERRVAAAERRYGTLVEGLSSGLAIVRGGRVVFANGEFARLVGATPEALYGRPLRDRIAAEDLLALEEALGLVANEGGRTSVECASVEEGGAKLAELRLDASPIELDEGPAVLLVASDRTEQRRVEAELRRNEQRLDSVLEAVSDGILLLVDGIEGARVHLVNEAFGTLFGVPARELLGLSEGELATRLRAAPGCGEEIAELLGAREEGARTERYERRGAARVDLEVTLVPHVDGDGRRRGRVLACRDLTRQRETERRLQMQAEQLQLSKVMLEQAYRRLEESNRELQGRGDQLRVMNDELRKLDQMKSNLIGNVSHELQTPLVSIRGYTEMILRERLGPITDEQRKGLDLCLKNIDRLISMIDNLLVLARAQGENEKLELTHFDLRALITEAVDLLREKIVERQIRFSSQIEGNDLRIHADRDKILQVLINLLSNAVKFNRHNGRVRVNARVVRPGFAEVHVEDTGVGIPEDERERILERHYQVASGDASVQGSGIGLAIVKEILDAHGCTIRVESRLGEGSRFRFTLPLSPQPSQEQGSDAAAPSDEPGSTPRSGELYEPEARPRFRIIRPQEPPTR